MLIDTVSGRIISGSAHWQTLSFSFIIGFELLPQDKKRGPVVRSPLLATLSALSLVSGPHSEFPVRWASIDRFRQFPRNGAAHHDRNSRPFNELFRRGVVTSRAGQRESCSSRSYSILASRRNQDAFSLNFSKNKRLLKVGSGRCQSAQGNRPSAGSGEAGASAARTVRRLPLPGTLLHFYRFDVQCANDSFQRRQDASQG